MAIWDRIAPRAAKPIDADRSAALIWAVLLDHAKECTKSISDGLPDSGERLDFHQLYFEVGTFLTYRMDLHLSQQKHASARSTVVGRVLGCWADLMGDLWGDEAAIVCDQRLQFYAGLLRSGASPGLLLHHLGQLTLLCYKKTGPRPYDANSPIVVADFVLVSAISSKWIALGKYHMPSMLEAVSQVLQS